MKLILALTPVAVSALLLAGCVGAPDSAPTALPSPTTSNVATPTPTPTPTAEPSSFTVDGAGWGIKGPDGATEGLWGDASGAASSDEPDLLTALTALLDAEPVSSVRPGNSHTPEFNVYTWPGVTLGVSTKQKDDFHWNPYVIISAPRSGTTELRTTAGFVVGASQQSDLEAEAVSSGSDAAGGTFYNIEPDHEVPGGELNDAWNTVQVTVDGGGTVVQIIAPVPYGNVL